MKFLSSLAEAYHIAVDYPPLNAYTTDYDAYWNAKRGGAMGGLSDFQKARATWIASRIIPGSTTLDFGCGDGAVLEYLRAQTGTQIIGADISARAIEHLRSRGIPALQLPTDLNAQVHLLPRVDYIVACEVLEHLQNPEFLLNSLVKIARKSVFFSIPNSGYFAHRARVILGRSYLQWRHHPGEHLRFWTVQDLRWWLGELGFRESTTVHLYEGLPLLNSWWGSLFAMGIVCEIRCH